MTGYTVHTGASKKFTEGWDKIFDKKKSKGKSTKKKKSARAKSSSGNAKKKKS